jgi:hypothetical protein
VRADERAWLCDAKVLPKRSPRAVRVLGIDGDHVEASEQAQWKEDGKVVRSSSRAPCRPPKVPAVDRNWIGHCKAGWLCPEHEEEFSAPLEVGEAEADALRLANRRPYVRKHQTEFKTTPSQRAWVAGAKQVPGATVVHNGAGACVCTHGGTVYNPACTVRAVGGIEAMKHRERGQGSGKEYEWVNEHQIRRRRPQTAPSAGSLLDQFQHMCRVQNSASAEGAQRVMKPHGWQAEGRQRAQRVVPAEKLQAAVDPHAWEPKHRDGRKPWKPWRYSVALPVHQHEREAPLKATRKQAAASSTSVFRPSSAASKCMVQRSVAMHPKNLGHAF